MNTSDIGRAAPQLRLPFPDSISSFDDLAITSANETAFAIIRKWRDWHSPALCLVGPVQCGLGIAATLWAREADATLLSAAAFEKLSVGDIEALSDRNCVIDLADRVTNEGHLLTLINLIHAKHKRLLLTARTAGGNWACSSPDLKSRLDAMPVAEIYAPDEAMIKARLRASLKLRYIKLNDATVDFLAIRLPRSYEAIEDYVTRLDKAVDETGRGPSIHLARSVLEDGVSTRTLFNDEHD